MRLRNQKLVDMFNIWIMLVLRKRKVNMVKDRINDLWFKIFYEGTESVGMKNRKDVSVKGIKGKMKGDVFIIGKLKVLGVRDTMEKLNEFMGDTVFFKEYIIFNGEKNIRRVEDCSIKEMDDMDRMDGWTDVVRTKWRGGSRLG